MSGLPELKKWLAPWEKDANGDPIPEEDQELDPGKLKNFLHGLLSDKDRLKGREQELAQQVQQLTTQRDELQQKVQADEDGGDELKAVQRRAEAAEKRLQDAETASRKQLALEVALDIEGITAKQARSLAKRMQGSNEEELAADAKSLIEDLGLHIGPAKPAEDEGDADDDSGSGLRRTPAKNLRRGGAGVDTETPSGLPDPNDQKAMDDFFASRF